MTIPIISSAFFLWKSGSIDIFILNFFFNNHGKVGKGLIRATISRVRGDSISISILLLRGRKEKKKEEMNLLS